MGLQLDRPLVRKRTTLVEVVLKRGLIHHNFLIQDHGNLIPDHSNQNLVPAPRRLVGNNQRITSLATNPIVPKSARSLVRIGVLPLDIPYLHLRDSPQINSAIRIFSMLVFQLQFKVRIASLSRKVEPLAIIHNHPVLHLPVLRNILEALLLFCSQFIFRESHPFYRILGSAPPPPCQIYSIKKRIIDTLRRLLYYRDKLDGIDNDIPFSSLIRNLNLHGLSLFEIKLSQQEPLTFSKPRSRLINDDDLQSIPVKFHRHRHLLRAIAEGWIDYPNFVSSIFRQVRNKACHLLYPLLLSVMAIAHPHEGPGTAALLLKAREFGIQIIDDNASQLI